MSRVFAAAAVFAISTISAAPETPAWPPRVSRLPMAILDLSAASGQSELKVHLQEAAASVQPGFGAPGLEPTAQYLMSVYHACIGRL